MQTTDDAKPEPKPEPTIWAVPDDMWEIIEEILSREYPRHRQDRKRVPLRPVLDGVVYKLRTGCQWNRIPKEYGDDSTIHRHFQAWCAMGIFDAIWRPLRFNKGCEAAFEDCGFDPNVEFTDEPIDYIFRNHPYDYAG